MAAHVVVIDSTFRRVTVKTTPAKPLSDVLNEACSKLGLKSEQYGLKHNNKPVDLSRTVRLSGLTSGARLNLVQASRSPSVVSVALQLPPMSATGSSGETMRLTDKFPSDTAIWQILRRFEAGVAGNASEAGGPSHNLTQRATPLISGGSDRASGSGRLCYQMPVVNVMGRELSSFIELQKTLGQLGFSAGSCLLRLSYQNTQQPLEEAMAEISRYFQASDHAPGATASTGVQPPQNSGPLHDPGDLTSQSTDRNSEALVGESAERRELGEGQQHEIYSAEAAPVAAGYDPDFAPQTQQHSSTTSDLSPPAGTTAGLSIFAPPSSSTPAAATQISHNEADYVPTVAHAQQHQARLVAETRNKKLLSDSELAVQQQARDTALSGVKEVVVRIRFPDQSQAQQQFSQDATTKDVYDFCRELMYRPAGEPFSVRTTGSKGASEALPEGKTKLIRDMGWQGRILVTVVWDDNVSLEARRRPCLKEQYRQRAEKLTVDLPPGTDLGETSGERVPLGKGKGKAQDSSGGGGGVESKLRGFLKGLSKK